MTMRSRRAYLIKPYYDWMVDSELTPYLSVEVNSPQVKVPEKFIQNGQIILNIKPAAIRDLKIDNKAVSFRATFGGVEENVYVPLSAVRALYAKENQDGIVFDDQDDESELPPEPSKPNLRILD